MALRAVQHGRSLAFSSWHAGRSDIAIFQRGPRPATTWDAARETSGYPSPGAPKGKKRASNQISAGARQVSSSEIMRRESSAQAAAARAPLPVRLSVPLDPMARASG